ncbi:PREDICTED: insulin-like growth factor-binding protein 7 [Chaetura pelagica]|uniref:insulin-like growth factor-binding protein 7 n=1 Tax=Chaetura pelagica TaxID=8897 RepID=UPI000523A3E0|nr:PREDICTED: insulin-like growth factor-binding protein 7 [Chaetura pelagica]
MRKSIHPGQIWEHGELAPLSGGFGALHFLGTVPTDSSSKVQRSLRNVAGFCCRQQPSAPRGPPGNHTKRVPQTKAKEAAGNNFVPRPSIVTPPKDIWNVTGAQIYLSCEVMGIPTPVLIWNKIIRGQYGVQRMELLPGDRENLAIQTRGGPEKHEVTGWVLISPLSKDDAGEYECHASNAKGEATASAKIHVVETLHEIALTKDGGAEL